MALAIDASTPVKATGTGTAVTTASFTPPSGSLIVLLYGANDATTGADCSISSVTNTGTAITWTRRARKNPNASSTGGAGTSGGAEIWTGVGTGGAITVTANGVGSGTGFEKMLKAVVLTGADTTSLANVAAATSTSGLPSVALASCLAGSYVFAMSSDWAAKGLGTAGTSQTIIDEFTLTSQITLHAWRTTSTLASAGSQTMNLTAPSAEQYNVAALEVRASGSAFSGSVALTGSGTLALAGTPAETGAAGFSGGGSLSFAATPAIPGSVSTSGGGTLALGGTPSVPGAASLAGSGTLTLSGAAVYLGSIALAGGGTLSFTATPSIPGSAALSGAGTLSGAATPGETGSVAFSGAGVLTLSGVAGGGASNFSGLVMLTGSGSLGTSATPAFAGALSLGSEGVLTLSTGGTVYQFVTPGHEMPMDPTGKDFLWSRVKYVQGDAVVKYTDGTYKLVQVHNPDEPNIDHVYLGGHVHTVSDAEAVLLIQAGYGAYLTVVTG